MTAAVRHLRPRGNGETQQTTTVELFFDLVYVFAVTQLSHQILGDLSVAGVARAAFLLLVVWWAWIYTTWMANWFDPASPPVRGVLTAVMLGSLLMAAALPEAFGERALLFAASYVALQVGRNAAAAWLLHRRHRLRDVFERLVVWSAASGVLWLAGAALDSDERLILWIPALALELAAPGGRLLAAGSRPRRHDRLRHRGQPLRRALPGLHHHRARRVDRRHGSDRIRGGAHLDGRALPDRRVRGDRGAVVAVLRRDHRARARHAQPLRRPRSPRTRRLHLRASADRRGHHRDRGRQRPADRRAARGARRVGVAMILGGPALYLLGESLFAWRMTGATNPKRLAVAALLILLVPVGGQVSALVLSLVVAALLPALAVWERGAPGAQPLARAA